MRQSFFASALWLSLIQTSVDARAHKFPQLKIRNGVPVQKAPEQAGGVLNWIHHHLLRSDVQRRQDPNTCYEDSYYDFVQDMPGSQRFCQGYMDYPNQTITVDYTPTSTFTDTYTTDVFTSTEVVRTTPYSTVTVTGTEALKAKREALPQITARARLEQTEINAVFNMFRRQNQDSASDSGSVNSTSSMSSAFTSACSCMTYGGSTVTEIYTNEPTVTTLSAFGLSTTITTTTRVAGTIVTTTYAVVQPSGQTNGVSPPPSASGTGVFASSPPVAYSSGAPVPYSSGAPAAPASSANATVVSPTTGPSSPPTPTSQPIVCPEDDGAVVSQLVDNERFDYLVKCSTDLTATNFYGALYYSSFGQCISACSFADANFSSPVCQGVSYYNSPNVDGYNCFLKTSGNGSVPMTGVESAILLRIVMGVSGGDPAGTTTESAPFATEPPSGNSTHMSSSLSAAMGNSTSSMPMITPAPQIPVSGLMVNGYTSFSNYVSAGSTYSTGTVFSTYHSASGSWYSAYYTSYTLAWASATTEYAYGATETTIAGSNSSSSHQEGASNGGYSIISDQNSTTYGGGFMNTTEVISNQTYAQNGTELSSTAVTSFYSVQTSAAGSGGASGGGAGGANGSITSDLTTSTSYYSTQTVIINSGGTGGASAAFASGYVTVSSPTPSATTIITSGGYAYSSGYIISGVAGGTGGASGYSGGGSITSAPGSISSTIIVNSNGSAYSSGFFASGSVGGAGGWSGYAGAGSVTSAPASISAIVIVNANGSAYSSGFMASGTVGGTAGASGTAASGSLPILSGPSPYPSTNISISPPVNTSMTGTAPSGTGTPPLSLTGHRHGPPIFQTPSPSPSYGFSDSAPPRVGGYGSSSTFVPTGTAPPSYLSLPASSGSPLPSTNTTSYDFSNTAPPRVGGYGSSSSFVPTGTAPPSYPSLPASSGSPLPSTNTTSYGFTNTMPPRVPGSESSSTFMPTGTAPSAYPSLSGLPSTCANATMILTTTVYTTTTEFRCYATCPPQGYGGYGGPQSFGPPVWGPPQGGPPANAPFMTAT